MIVVLLVTLTAGCAKRAEVSFHISIFRRPPAQDSASTAGGGLSVPDDLPTNLAILRSGHLWLATAPRLNDRIQDADRVRASLKIRTVHLEETAKAVGADVTVSASGARMDDVRFALDALVERYGEYLAGHRIGEISRSR